MFEHVEELVREHGELEKQLSDPGVHGDQNRARTLGRRYAELGPIVATYLVWKATAGDLRVPKINLMVALGRCGEHAEAAQIAASLIEKPPQDAHASAHLTTMIWQGKLKSMCVFLGSFQATHALPTSSA